MRQIRALATLAVASLIPLNADGTLVTLSFEGKVHMLVLKHGSKHVQGRV